MEMNAAEACRVTQQRGSRGSAFENVVVCVMYADRSRGLQPVRSRAWQMRIDVESLRLSKHASYNRLDDVCGATCKEEQCTSRRRPGE